jgi:WD40 repeat protein
LIQGKNSNEPIYVQIKSRYFYSLSFYRSGLLAVGFIDGIIEVWNKDTLKVCTEEGFEFQKDLKFMGHNSHVLSLEFSANGKVLASGDSEGTIKVWNFAKGKCIKKLEKAHTENGITCIRFNESISIIYSSSFDKVIKSHGLKSASLLKEYKGHSGPITDFQLIEDEDRMISASGDGTLRIWNLISTTCVKIINPLTLNKGEEGLMDVSIVSLQMYPNQQDKERRHWCLVCHEGSNIALLINIKTNALVNSFYNDKLKTSFTYAIFDEEGKYVLCPCSDNYMYAFDSKSAKMVSMVELPPSKQGQNLFTRLLRLEY